MNVVLPRVGFLFELLVEGGGGIAIAGAGVSWSGECNVQRPKKSSRGIAANPVDRPRG
jgi:hypothetical protein